MDENDEIISAVQEGNLDRIKEAMRSPDLRSRYQRGYHPLCKAIECGHKDIVEFLLQQGAAVNIPDGAECKNQDPPLTLAIRKEDISLVYKLLERGASINEASDIYSATPLDLAISIGNTEIIKLLLKDIDVTDKKGKTALHLAVEKVQLLTVETILKYHPNIYNESNRKSLIVAINTYNSRFEDKADREAIITSLYQYGFTVKPEDLENCDLLHKSINEGLSIVVENFLKHDVNINSEFFTAISNSQGVWRNGLTLLHTACERGEVNIVQCLLDEGAKIDATTVDGETPLIIATTKEHKDIIGLLLHRGANIDHRDKTGDTALYYAALSGDKDIVEMILRRHPDVNNKGNRKCIRFFCDKRVRKNKLKQKCNGIVNSLYQYGFTINLNDLQDFHLLTKAINYGCLLIVEDFLRYGAMRRFSSARKISPLHLAAEWNQKDVIKLLVNYGFSVNAKDRSGQTPIFSCIMSSMFLANEDCAQTTTETLRLLLDLGADVIVSDTNGMTPLHYVAMHLVGMEEAAKWLIRRGARVHDHRFGAEPISTPFSNAIEQKNTGLQALFLKHIRADFRNSTHRELLVLASERDSTVLFEIPLNSGADINSVDDNGITTFHFAFVNGCDKLITKLLEYGNDFSEIEAILSILNSDYNYRRDIQNYLKMYMVRLIVAGLIKSDVGPYVVKGNVNLVDVCSRELQTMKNETIPHSVVPFRSILTEAQTLLATYAKNERLVEFLKCYECYKKFPLYSGVMKGLIWRGIVRRILLEKSVNMFRSYCGIFRDLPDICVEHILSYLKDGELRTFIKMAKFDVGKPKRY